MIDSINHFHDYTHCLSSLREYPFSTCTDFAKKLTFLITKYAHIRTCECQRVRNIVFFEKFAYVLTGWSLANEISFVDLKSCNYLALRLDLLIELFLRYLSNTQKVISLPSNCKLTFLKPKGVWVQNLSFLAKIISGL